MNLIKDNCRSIQTFFRVSLSRKHTPNRTSRRNLNHIPVNIAHRSKFRFTLNNLSSITKSNSCLLLLGCTRINLATIITIKKKPESEACHKCRFAVFTSLAPECRTLLKQTLLIKFKSLSQQLFLPRPQSNALASITCNRILCQRDKRIYKIDSIQTSRTKLKFARCHKSRRP